MKAQTIINNCEQHGVIHWKKLRELVNQDRARCAKAGEYSEINKTGGKTWKHRYNRT